MRARAQTITVLFALLLPLGAAAQEDRFDVSAFAKKLALATDGKGHYLAFVPHGGSDERELFYGDGKVFYRQRVIGYFTDPKSYDFTFWDPRIGSGWQRSFEFSDGKYKLQCSDRATELTRVPDAEARKLLDAAEFRQPRWKRQAYALARDDRGNYYFVDQAREPENNKNFRLFTGPRGNLKLAKMKNVVSDSAGEIFATKKGDLRLVIGHTAAKWIRGKKGIDLVVLPVVDNAPMIYTDLGVYAGQPLGTPCDDL